MVIYTLEPFTNQDGSFVTVTCPRCHGSFVADSDWPGRVCPLCKRVSTRPGDGALVYDGNTTIRVSMAEARALVFVGVATYSPEDGPKGIVFRPLDGRSTREACSNLSRFS